LQAREKKKKEAAAAKRRWSMKKRESLLRPVPLAGGQHCFLWVTNASVRISANTRKMSDALRGKCRHEESVGWLVDRSVGAGARVGAFVGRMFGRFVPW
jgi:hypothetical protein